jgi:hypothetical protein
MAKSIDYKAQGFTQYHTGGGCIAWRKDYESGCYALITDEDGCSLPDHDAASVYVGLYDTEDGEELFGNAWRVIDGEQGVSIADNYGATYVRGA